MELRKELDELDHKICNNVNLNLDQKSKISNQKVSLLPQHLKYLSTPLN